MSGSATTVWGALSAAVERHAREPLFGQKRRDGWQWQSYRDFGREVLELAAGLTALGIGAGDRVALISDNRPEWAAVAYACYRIGAVVVPMYEAQSPDDWAFITRDAGAKLVFCAGQHVYERAAAFTNGASADGAARVAMRVPTGHEDSYHKLLVRGRRDPLAADAPTARAQDPASILYTSGTTASPKGVVLSHANIAENVEALLAAIPMSSDDRSLSLLPWAHSFGHTCELHAMLTLGGSIALGSVDKLADDLMAVHPTVLISVPAIFNRIHDTVSREMAARPPVIRKLFDTGLSLLRDKRHRKLKLSERVTLEAADRLVFSAIRARFGGKLRFAFSGGAALSTEVARFIDDLGITVYEGYGLTEAGPVVSTNRPGAHRIGSVGRPLAGVSVSIDHAETDDPDDGEIIVRGPSVMLGYHARPDENTRSRSADGGLRTGDIGRLDGDGFLYITGRLKEQYKLLNGKYVVPGPLEEALERSTYVKRVMIHGADHGYNVALVVVNLDTLHRWAEGRDLTFNSTAELLSSERVKSLILAEIGERSERFKPYERVKKVLLVDGDLTTENGMLTPTLRIKRRAVVATYHNQLEALYQER